MKTLMIAILAALVATAWAQEFRAPIGPQKPVRAMPTPPPLLQRPPVQGVIPRGLGNGRNPFQMLNPWAPARYGTWVDSTSFDPNHPGKWNGIKLFEIIF
jgi:hypothetical protein